MRTAAEAIRHVEDAVVKAGGAVLRYGGFYGPGATVTMMTEGRGFSDAKTKREFGGELRYPSWAQCFKEGLA